MLWLIGQISIFLLFAALIGFLIGWLLRAIWPSSRARVREGELQAALDRAGNRITDLEAGLRAKRLAANASAEQEEAALRRVENCEAELADLRARGTDSGEVGRLRSELDAATRSMEALHRELAAIKAETEAAASLRTVEAHPSDAEVADDEPTTSSEAADTTPAQGGLFLVQDEGDADVDATETIVSELFTPAGEDDEAYLETQRLAAVAEVTERFQYAEDVMPDDLKRIHGIGPALERLLRAMNITTFQQIADFTDDDVDLVSTALGRAFPDRIRRDDWMGGARTLMAEDQPDE